MRLNGDYDQRSSSAHVEQNGSNTNGDNFFINFSINTNEYKSSLSITKPQYKVDFNVNQSINTIFGFKKKVYSQGNHIAENIPDVSTTQACFITIDLIKPNVLFSKGKTKTLDYVRVIPTYTNGVGS